MMMPMALRALRTHLAGLCAVYRAQRKIRFRLRRCRNLMSLLRLTTFIHYHNKIAVNASHVRLLSTKLVVASRAPRALRRVVL